MYPVELKCNNGRGIAMIFCYIFLGLMMVGAIAAGLVAGQGKSLRRFGIGLGVAELCCLPLVIQVVVSPKLGKTLLWQFARIPERFAYQSDFLPVRGPDMIQSVVLWGALVFAILLVFFLYVIAFNCRKTAENIYIAAGGVLLFGVIFYFCSIWGFYGLGSFIELFRGERVYSAPGLERSFFLTVLVLTGVILALWTVYSFRTKRNGWKVLLVQAGIVVGIYAVCWLLALAAAFPYGYHMQGKAEGRKVTSWRVVVEVPPAVKLQNDKIQEFQDKYKNLELPYESIYHWRNEEHKNLVPAEKREYTLKNFDTPESEELCRVYEAAIKGYDWHGEVNLAGLNQIRAYARFRAGRAALFSETNQPEKVLPELMKITAVDTEILNDTPFLIGELVRIAARSIWCNALVKFGPDGPEYAPVYREALALMKSRRVHLAPEYGYFLNSLEKGLHFRTNRTEPVGRYVEVLSAPLQVAYSAKTLSILFGMDEAIAGLESQEVFEERKSSADVLGTLRNVAIKSRVSLVMGTTATALKCYRSEKGVYPDALEKLVPEYLEKLPVCPYTGKPLIYESDGATFKFSLPDEKWGKYHKLDNLKNY